MTEQLAFARATDPQTSWDAARSVKGLRESQEAVLTVVAALGGRATDEQIAARYARLTWLPMQSPSGLRTRRRELVDLGYLQDSGERARTQSNRHTIIWETT